MQSSIRIMGLVQYAGRNTAELPVRNILDTSYLTYLKAGFKDMFGTRDGDYIIPGRHLPEFVKFNLQHLQNVTGAIVRKQLLVPESVLTEIGSGLTKLESYRGEIPRRSIRGTCLEIYHQAFSEFTDLVRRTPHLDPQEGFSLNDAYEYNDIFQTVKQTSCAIYDRVKYGKPHSQQSKQLETDLHVAAMALFFARGTDVNVFTNDHDIHDACKDSGSGLTSNTNLAPRYRVNIFSVPTPGLPPRVVPLFFESPTPVLQRSVACFN